MIGPDHGKISELENRAMIDPVADHKIIHEVLGAGITINLVQEQGNVQHLAVS